MLRTATVAPKTMPAPRSARRQLPASFALAGMLDFDVLQRERDARQDQPAPLLRRREPRVRDGVHLALHRALAGAADADAAGERQLLPVILERLEDGLAALVRIPLAEIGHLRLALGHRLRVELGRRRELLE